MTANTGESSETDYFQNSYKLSPISPKCVLRLQRMTLDTLELISEVDKVIQHLYRRRVELKLNGLIFAKGYWRDSKYFVLYSTALPGKRRVFKYIGKNPEKIKAADDAMRRACEFEHLSAKIAHLELLTEQCYSELGSVARALSDICLAGE